MKNILLIGLGRFGRHMAEQLNQMGTWCEAGSCKSRTRCSGKIPSEKWSRQRDLSRKAGGKMGIYPIC